MRTAAGADIALKPVRLAKDDILKFMRRNYGLLLYGALFPGVFPALRSKRNM